MAKLVIVLALSIGSVLFGYLVQRSAVPANPEYRSAAVAKLSRIAKWIKLVTMAGLIPWPIMFSFWRITVMSPKFLILPVIGVFSLVVGGVASLLMIRFSDLTPGKAGSLFACGMMTNLGIIGGLVGMLFFGNEGYLAVQLFTMFEAFTYYVFVFPMSQQIGEGGGAKFRFRPGLALSKPMSFVPIGAIFIGLILRALKIPPPGILDRISAILVPAVAGLIGFTIGLTLKISRMRYYKRESIMIVLIKFVIIPAVVIPVAILTGLPYLMGGVAFKLVVVLSFGPVALTAMVPPQLYGLDMDLANTLWLITTALNLVIVPILVLLMI